MKFKYSSQLLPDYGILSSPRVSAMFANPKTGMEMPVFCLIDSGSASILINPQIGKAIGVDVQSGEPISFGGVGGSVLGYKHRLKLRLMGDRREYEVECAFAEVGNVDALLGQIGFFDNYKVIFEKYKNEFAVIAKGTKK
jgi:hypothetical protein